MMKIKKLIEISRGTIYSSFYINDILVAICEKSKDYYCTISKSENPSRIRDKLKNTYKTKWQIEGVKLITGSNFDLDDFKDDYPDLRWGHQGSILSVKKVKEIFNKYDI